MPFTFIYSSSFVRSKYIGITVFLRLFGLRIMAPYKNAVALQHGV